MAVFSPELRQRVSTPPSEAMPPNRPSPTASTSVAPSSRRSNASGAPPAPSHPRLPRGPRPTLSDDDRAALAAWVEATPDATAEELARRLGAERGVSVGRMVVNRALLPLGLTLKKTLRGIAHDPTNRTAKMSESSGRPS